jgi:signal transduction histidine kinase
MQRRLRFIFALLAVCLLGSYGFQAYWLYGSYQLARAQFATDTREALEAVVQQVQVQHTRKVFNIKLNNYDGPHDAPGTTHRWQIERLDTGLTSTQATRPAPAQQPRVLVLRPRAASPGPPPPAPPSEAELLAQARREQARSARTDSLALKLSTFVVNSWYRRPAADLRALGRSYRVELGRRHAEQPFRLDTLASRTTPATAAQQAGYTLHTPAVQLNPVSGSALVASFRPPTTYLLGRLGGSLAGSALLLALTTTCFWLMLSTILRQKKLSEVKSDFINNMTHELKTPLATVSAAVEALQDFGALGDPARADLYLTMARQETRRLADLVEKVLDVATAERSGHTLQLHPELVHPAELIAGLVRRHQLQAPKPVRFEVEVAAASAVRLDPLHMAGVLHNLLDNAIKYSAEAVTIAIRGQAAAGGWQLQVSDDGPGIPRSYQAAIFDQFFRVPTGNLHPVKGFGLGLYYVRQVMERHGGHVSVRSEPGRGSTFTLWLPE